jgi:outer membrane protein OmpA-like peptidoglycan-associated protein
VNGYQDEDGCPDTVPVAIAQFTGTIEGVNFKLASAEILATSNARLDQAAGVLAQYPALRIEIQGHTDNLPILSGVKYADNLALSQARAESVRDYLVKKGIAADRLVAKGYGDTQPLVSMTDANGNRLRGNARDAARAKNRRVEFQPLQPATTPPPPPPVPTP